MSGYEVDPVGLAGQAPKYEAVAAQVGVICDTLRARLEAEGACHAPRARLCPTAGVPLPGGLSDPLGMLPSWHEQRKPLSKRLRVFDAIRVI